MRSQWLTNTDTIATLEHPTESHSELLVLEVQVAEMRLVNDLLWHRYFQCHTSIEPIAIVEDNMSAVAPDYTSVVWVECLEDIHCCLG
jgi:hypothetical protein